MSNNRSRILMKNVFPAIFGQICFFLFTIIDGIFVGNGVGQDALGAINIVFPFVMVVNALFMLTSVGGVTITAIRLGRGDTAGANKAFMHSILCMFCTAVALSLVGVLFTKPLGHILGANETYIGYVTDYLIWYSAFIMPSAFSTLFQFFCRNDGSPFLVMTATVIASALNIFLDWLFVFPLRMGLAGAAIATGISQTAALLIVLIHFVLKMGNLRFCKFKPEISLIKKIAMRGFPETIAQFATPVATICTNYMLLSMIGEIAVNSFSIIAYVASFSVAIFFGVSGGAQPLFGNCYGEKNEADLKFYFRTSIIIDIIGSVAVYIALFFIGAPICRMFGADAETLAFTLDAMPLYAVGFIFQSVNTIISAYLYSTKRTREAVILNLLRSFALTCVVILVMPLIFGADSVWLTFAAYEFISMLIGMMLIWLSERHGVVFK